MVSVGSGGVAGEEGVNGAIARERVGEFLRRGFSVRVHWCCCFGDRSTRTSLTSRTITPAPSPTTKPSRSRLKGREARAGTSLEEVVRLRDRSKPVIASGWMQDSAPPATMTSASPKAMKRAASPIECAPVVQAVETA